MLEIELNQTQQRKLNVELSPGADYEYNELNADIVTYNKPTQIVTADRDNATDENTPEAKIEFTPTKNGHNGDKVVLKTKVKSLPETNLELDVSSINSEANWDNEVIVTSNANVFDLSSDNDNVTLTQTAPNKFNVHTVREGSSNVTVTATAPGCKSKSVTIPVTITAEPTRVSCIPEPGEYLMYVGEKRTFQFFHNGVDVTTYASQQNTGRIVYHPENGTFDITCNAVNGRQRFRVETSKPGQPAKDVQIFVTPIAEKPYINFSEDGAYFEGVDSPRKTNINVEHNLPSVSVSTLNSKVVTFSCGPLGGNLSFTPQGKGVSSLRYTSFEGKGGITKYLKVIVDEPCVTFNDLLYPTFDAFNAGEFSLAGAQLRSGADSFDVAGADFFDYDSESKKVTFKNMKIGKKYQLRIIPIVGGNYIYANDSYITFKCIEPQYSHLDVPQVGVAVEPLEFVEIPVTSSDANYSVQVSDSFYAWAEKIDTGLRIHGTSQGDTTIVLTAKEPGKLPKSKIIDVKVTESLPKPEIVLTPWKQLKVGINKRMKVDIGLKYCDSYTFVEKRRDRVTWDNDKQEIVAGGIVTTGTNYPYSYIEFTPRRGNITGDMRYLEVEVIDETLTMLEVTPTTPEMWEGDATTMTVTTEAADFTYETLDDKLQVTRQDNTLRLQSTLGKYGTSQIRIKAKADGMREAVKTVNVNIKDHSRITIDPDDRDITLEVGQAKRYRCTYNTTNGNNTTRYVGLRKSNNNVREQAHSSNDFSFIGASVGQCQLTLYGTKWGSHYTEVVINVNVIPAPAAPIEVDKRIVSIPSVNQTATVTLTDASNVNIESTNRNVATSTLSGNTLTITSKASGIAHIRLWRTGQESAEVRVKALVAKPTVLIDNKLDPLWTRRSGASVQHPVPTYQNGADDYDFVIDHPDQLEYDKATRTIRTKGTLVRGNEYTIKLIPKVGGVAQDAESYSLLIIKGQ